MLLEHIVSLLVYPDLTKIPIRLLHVLNLWLKGQGMAKIDPLTGQPQSADQTEVKFPFQ